MNEIKKAGLSYVKTHFDRGCYITSVEEEEDRMLSSFIAGVEWKNQNILSDLLSQPKEQREFFSEYLDMIRSVQFSIETYRGQQDNLSIQNTDLWIESYIELVPGLQVFRDFLRNEMKRLGIDKHPDFAYKKDFNHYYTSNIHKIKELQDSFKDSKK